MQPHRPRPRPGTRLDGLLALPILPGAGGALGWDLAFMHLSALLSAVPNVVSASGDLDVNIAGITSDSRQVAPGVLFVAYVGVGADGHRYVGDAIARHAAAVVGEKPLTGLTVPFVQVADGREALAWLSAAWYGHPGRAMRVVGITGTDGKTTTANLLFSILRAAGRRVGLISTVHAVIPARGAESGGDMLYDTGFHTTTPDALDVQRYLALMREAGSSEAILEVTSHGLVQHRVTGCEFDVAVITNITHEHLDYHGSYRTYQEAKAMLFRALVKSERKPGTPKTSVLNRDDGSFELLSLIPAERTLTYGIADAAQSIRGPFGYSEETDVCLGARVPLPEGEQHITLTAMNIRHTPAGSEFDVQLAAGLTPGRVLTRWQLLTPLIGDFNVYNVLAATGAALALNVNVPAIQEGVRALAAVPGRMERVDRGQAFTAIVDFAHTPNALARALEAARDFIPPMPDLRRRSAGRVIVVFGCAGLRDREKRRLMGEVAARLADISIITAEDPRTENLDAIMAETADALAQAGRIEGRDFARAADRQHAIQLAVRRARPGDVVIVCGKGHERSMCFGDIEYAWRDQDALAWALDAEQGVNAAPPFILPTWGEAPALSPWVGDSEP
jgi:UDP-N-acetylmuramoyl-L-alanyl-D-glutamate--2,6-diaminopimelate ligase